MAGIALRVCRGSKKNRKKVADTFSISEASLFS
jgi:hypothetical protein